MRVFEQRIYHNECKVGKIGYVRPGSTDLVAITSYWTSPIAVTTLFEVEAIPRLIELLHNAYESRTRRGSGEPFQFTKLM